jgi:hypothetical protein
LPSAGITTQKPTHFDLNQESERAAAAQRLPVKKGFADGGNRPCP